MKESKKILPPSFFFGDEGLSPHVVVIFFAAFHFLPEDAFGPNGLLPVDVAKRRASVILLAKKRDAEENEHTGHVKQGKQILVRHSACLAHHIFFLQIRGLRLALSPPPFYVFTTLML